MLASQEGNIEIVKLLLEASANVNDKEIKGWTALMLASQEGNIEIVKLLLETKADVNEKNNNGDIALIIASRKAHKELVEFLIEKGANINYKGNKGWTSLIQALRKGHIEVVETLIKKGIDICGRDNSGKIVLTHVSKMLKSSKRKSEKDKYIEIAYMIVRKMAEDYIQLFISFNKSINIFQNIKDDIHDHINILYSLQNLPIELFEEVINKF